MPPAPALLPLDDRPCNRLFPLRLARIAGRVVRIPPLTVLGHFRQAGDPEACAAWLATQAHHAAGLIVSIDMLCYGGLIASRTPAATVDQARARLRVLRALHQAHPELPILAFGVITRLGTTVTSAEALELHRRLVEYSILRDRVERLGEITEQPALEALTARLGPEVVERYLAVRRRNHEINRELVALAGEGVVQVAILSQEDAAPAGLHRAEQAELQRMIAAAGLGNRVLLYPGADEVGCVLLARLLAPGLRVRVHYATAEGAERIARYEDRPLCETVAGQLAAAGALQTSEGTVDLHLAVNTPRGEQQEAEQAEERDPDRAGLTPFMQQMARLVAGGDPVAVADCAYANGADPALVAGLAEHALSARLAGYAGWNTAGNTIGTALAQGLLFAVARTGWDRRRAHAHARFTFERLVDDYAFQTLARPYAYREARAEGVSPFALGVAAGRFQDLVRKLVTPEAEALFDRHFLGRTLPGGFTPHSLDRLHLRLPWPRLFELEVRAAMGLGEVQVSEHMV